MLNRKRITHGNITTVDWHSPQQQSTSTLYHFIKNWRILIAGFIAGICVTIFCEDYIFKSTSYLTSSVKSAEQPISIKNNKTNSTDSPTVHKKPVFDFYTQLADVKNISSTNTMLSNPDTKAFNIKSEHQKIVTHVGTEIMQKNIKDTPDQPAVAINKKNNISQLTQTNTNVTKYLIQIASFKKEGAAKNFQQKLQTWGIKAQINSTIQQDKSQWYRIRTGPFLNLSVAKNMLDILTTHNLQGLLIKQSASGEK